MRILKVVDIGGNLVSLVFFFSLLIGLTSGLGVNWGTRASHPLPPSKVVRMLKDNGFQRVKLFDADDSVMRALGKSGLQVMVGIPNDMLADLATEVRIAENWVSKNVSSFISSHGVDIRYVAVGNEPFLTTYNGTFEKSTLPALQNIQSALIKAGLSNQVKVTCPLNADVYQSLSNLPSDGDFRTDIQQLMLDIVKFLNDNEAPFTVNIYPFLSLYTDPNFPGEFAFFDGKADPLNDKGTIYTNVFDANHDTLVWALQKNGFGKMPIIVGEIGWPTDGNLNANLQLAQRFNQGFMTRIDKGTPMRPGPVDAYLFGLIDEDAKSIQPGNFERHWGLFYFDGKPKYMLKLAANSNGLVPVKDVHYLPQKWCVLAPTANPTDTQLANSVGYACDRGDCTSLGYGSSCEKLDLRGNVSYAFNSYYQMHDQIDSACKFSNLAVVTDKDPSTRDCKFRIMIQADAATGLMQRGQGWLTKPRCLLGLSLILIAVMM